MAQTDAMETAKEVLRQIIKYRFWISIGVAALFAVIAYSMGSGPIREAGGEGDQRPSRAAEKEVEDLQPAEHSHQGVQADRRGEDAGIDQGRQHGVEELYDRQAPLLTWPEGVQERFQSWGRKWPENVDPSKVELAIVDYIEAYPAYVDMVYKTFNPFDYETGEGVVAAPPEGGAAAAGAVRRRALPDLGQGLGRAGTALDPAHRSGSHRRGQQERQELG